MPGKGYRVITIKAALIEKARVAFEQRKAQLPDGTSFSKFISEVIVKGLEAKDEPPSSPPSDNIPIKWEY